MTTSSGSQHRDFDTLRTTLHRSLRRHVIDNEQVSSAFANLWAELEIAALERSLDRHESAAPERTAVGAHLT